jgi:murein DD-endopeptidase MepM/ murein hydrolase activator NlpD
VALSGWQLGCALAAFALAVALAVSAAHLWALRHAASTESGMLHSFIADVQRREQQRSESYLRQNLDVMATKLGEMQARLLRLDSLGDRVARAIGFKPQDFLFGQAPGQGGALVQPAGSRDLSLGELGERLDQLSRQLEERTERLGVIQSIVSLDAARRAFHPDARPMDGGTLASNFGWRIDPFTGRQAFHEGIDFIAAPGTPIVAAASGIVITAEFHAAFGNMVEIDHGNDLITRYAHASRLHVKPGDVVRKGQRIADVGSTGRSTGPHLHFEVRHRGIAQNPTSFLRVSG